MSRAYSQPDSNINAHQSAAVTATAAAATASSSSSLSSSLIPPGKQQHHHMEGRHSDYHHPHPQQQQQSGLSSPPQSPAPLLPSGLPAPVVAASTAAAAVTMKRKPAGSDDPCADGHRAIAKRPRKQTSETLFTTDQPPPSNGQYSQGPDVKFNPAAPPPADYGVHHPSAATPSRPTTQGQYPEYLTRSQYPDASRGYPNTPGSTASSASSMAHHAQNPNIAASGHPYSPQHHYSPYGPPHHEMPQYHAPPGMYRPEYGSPYGGHPPNMPPPYGHVAPGAHPMSTVYSFVPIPGTHQQKRPRRRYEEIERMYKCGWNGCEKAYGTLNHLNAHVTMQSHGQKRTPEEFKEIRKEWKARKKEEETQRKAEEERQRQAVQQSGSVEGQGGADGSAQPPPGNYSQGVRQLPPLGYAPAGGQVSAQYGQPPTTMEGMPQYANGQMPSYYPQSPYGHGQMYHTSQSAAAATGQQESVAADK